MINVRTSLKKRKNEEKRDNDIGSHLKRKRLELRRNQDWVAKGICSVSYLSKIENNKAEENPMIVREIMEKLEVNPKEIDLQLQKRDYMEKALYAFYFCNQEDLHTLFLKVKDIKHDVTIKLIKLLYYLSLRDPKSTEIILTLEQVVPTMSDTNLHVFLVAAGLFYVEQEEYFNALEYLLASLKVEEKSEFLSALANMELFNLHQRMLKKNTSLKYGLEAERLMLRHHNYHRLYQYVLLRIEYISHELPSSALKELDKIHADFLPRELQMQYHSLYAKVAFDLEDDDLAKKHLLCIDKDSTYYFDSLVILYQLTKIKEEKERIGQEIESINIHKRNRPAMIRYRLIREDNDMRKKEYLKKVALPYARKVTNLYLHFHYVKWLAEICKKTSRYKEAVQYTEAHLRVLKKTNLLINQI